jgi:RNA polymerase sigma factor (sigma-70 family)
MSEVTRILSAIEQGDPRAADELLPLVYDELRRLAAHKMAQEKPGQTLDATALVHEAYVRLVAPSASPTAQAADAEKSVSSQGHKDEAHWKSRGHFYAAAAEAMRRILIESARRKKALRRGGDRQRLNLDLAEPAAPRLSEDLLALDEALEKLGENNPQKAQLVKLRYFAGLTMEQTAETLGISLATANRWWNYARAWLHREIADAEESG